MTSLLLLADRTVQLEGKININDILSFNPLYNSDSEMRTLANSEDSDKMLHYAGIY